MTDTFPASEGGEPRYADGAASSSASSRLPDAVGGEMLAGLRAREQRGQSTSLWDLHQLTGLPLNEAYAALRALEHRRLLTITDDPADPFGATVRLRVDGSDTDADRKVA